MNEEMSINPIIEIDVHGLYADEAVKKIEDAVNKASAAVYRIRVVHGFNRGTNIKDAIYRELGYGLCPKIKRIQAGENQGITELVLKEY